jgi:hypothetical protein
MALGAHRLDVARARIDSAEALVVAHGMTGWRPALDYARALLPSSRAMSRIT